MGENTAFVPVLVPINSTRAPVKILFSSSVLSLDTQVYFELKVLEWIQRIGHTQHHNFDDLRQVAT